MLEEEESLPFQVKVQIYSIKTSQNELQNKISFIQDLFLAKKVEKEDIKEIVLDEDNPLLPYFLKDFSEAHFPITFINQVPIGDIIELQKFENSRKLENVMKSPEQFSDRYSHLVDMINQYTISLSSSGEQLIVPEPASNEENGINFNKSHLMNENILLSSSPNRHGNSLSTSPSNYTIRGRNSLSLEQDYRLENNSVGESDDPGPFFSSNSNCASNNDSYLNIAVQTGKWLTDSVGSAVGQAVASVSGFIQPPLSDSNPKQFKDARGEFYIEYEVLQLNWYFRYQPRLLRFSKDKFVRINPQTKEVRALHRYNQIMKIIVNGKTLMIIKFKDPAIQPECYESNFLEQILNTILKNSVEAIPVCYE